MKPETGSDVHSVATMMTTERDLGLFKLSHWLRLNFPTEVMMPCAPKSKAPAYAHRSGAWTWCNAARSVSRELMRSEGRNFGIVLQRMCIIDVDDRSTANELEAQFPVLKQVPCESTHRGMHYFLLRSELADRCGYFDGANQVMRGVDFKSVCSTGSGGFVVVAPSHGRQWVRAPWSCGALITTIPDTLLEAIAVPRFGSIRVVFQAHTGHRVHAGTGPVTQLTYIAPFVDAAERDGAEETVVPLPQQFEACAAACIADAYTYGAPRQPAFVCDGVRPHNQLRQQAIAALQFADFLGMPIDQLRHLDEAACETIRTASVSPRLACTIARTRMTEVPFGCRRVADPLSGATIQRASVFSEHVRRGARVGHDPMIVCDPASVVWACLPENVRAQMMRHREQVFVAGGAILGALIADDNLPVNDIDTYIVGARTPQDANRIASGFITPGSESFITGSAVTITHPSEMHPVQVVLLMAETHKGVLNTFDMEPCRVGAFVDADGSLRVVCSGNWMACVEERAFPLCRRRWSSSATSRALKLALKGFCPYIAGLNRALARRHLDSRTISPNAVLTYIRRVCGLRTAAGAGACGALEILVAERITRGSHDPLHTLASARPFMPTSGYLEAKPVRTWSRIMKSANWLRTHIRLGGGATGAIAAPKRGQGGESGNASPWDSVAWRSVPKFSDQYAFHPAPMFLERMVSVDERNLRREMYV